MHRFRFSESLEVQNQEIFGTNFRSSLTVIICEMIMSPKSVIMCLYVNYSYIPSDFRSLEKWRCQDPRGSLC